MPVYMIQAGDGGPVKIGWSDTPVRRAQSFQAAHFVELRIIRTFDCERNGEYLFHEHYAALRLKGEWFTFCPTMLEISEPPPHVPLRERIGVSPPSNSDGPTVEQLVIAMVQHRIDLSLRQIAIMAVARQPARFLGNDVPCELRLVAEHLNIAPPPVVRAVNKLAKMGLMRRTRVKDDQRRVILSVTPDGARVLDAIASGTKPDVAAVFMDAA